MTRLAVVAVRDDATREGVATGRAGVVALVALVDAGRAGVVVRAGLVARRADNFDSRVSVLRVAYRDTKSA